MTDPTFEYAKITGKLAVMVGDGADDDDNPDLTYCDQGTVTFTPSVDYLQATDPDNPLLFTPAAIAATIDAQGRLSYNGEPYVLLLDLGSDTITPSVARNKGAWTVSYSNLKAGDVVVKLPQKAINPAAADNDTGGDDDQHLNDLGKLMPLAGTSGGTAITRGPQGEPGADGVGIPDTDDAADGDVIAWDADTATAVWVAPTGGSGGSVSSDDITDASTVGKAVLVATDAATARSALGAGTSSLALGTSSTTALAGDTAIPASPSDIGAATAAQGAKADSAVQPGDLADVATSGNSADLADATTVGKALMVASDAAAARTAIGAGTSDLALGTTSSTALAGNTAIPAPSDGNPRTLGTTSAGTATAYSRSDHVHKMPSASDVGAATTAQGTKADSAVQPADLDAYTPTADLDASLVGLGDVNNTSDADKPISDDTQAALDGKADLTDGLVPVSQASAGSVQTVIYTGSAWPARPTARTDVSVFYMALTSDDPAPDDFVSGTDYLYQPAAD